MSTIKAVSIAIGLVFIVMLISVYILFMVDDEEKRNTAKKTENVIDFKQSDLQGPKFVDESKKMRPMEDAPSYVHPSQYTITLKYSGKYIVNGPDNHYIGTYDTKEEAENAVKETVEMWRRLWLDGAFDNM